MNSAKMEKVLNFIILLLKLTDAFIHRSNQQITVNVPNYLVPVPKGMDTNLKNEGLVIGNCKVVINNVCPDPDVTFFIYTKNHIDEPEAVWIGSDPNESNLTKTSFNPAHPVKIIIHGYNSDMHLSALMEIKKQYFEKSDFNVFAVDWSPLCQSPCYLAALWNIQHVGVCTSKLVQRIRELGAKDIHVIGFSLGAHVSAHLANALRPYKLPRITGLDPAGPGFITATKENKLDKEDADFVDIIHTNVFIQGLVEELGHVDFYLNGGVIQPGCWAETRFFACNHHRAPLYFAETINTQLGFWGWPCPSYWDYLLGSCPPKDPQIIMGEHILNSSRGAHLVITESVAPFAVGKYTGPAVEILLKSEKHREEVLRNYKRAIEEFIDDDEVIDSLYNKTLRNSIIQQLAEEIAPFISVL